MPPQIADFRPEARTRERRGQTVFTCYPVTCACGHRRTMKRADANKAVATGACGRCSARMKGKKGFAVMAGRFGQKWAMRHVQAYQLEHPSKPEQIVEKLLAALGVGCQRQVWLATKAHGRRQWVCLLDFTFEVGQFTVALEVDGAYWHGLPGRSRSDRRKTSLCRRRGIVLVRISDGELTSANGRERVSHRIEAVYSSLSRLAARQPRAVERAGVPCG